jgi:hypothetical protein
MQRTISLLVFPALLCIASSAAGHHGAAPFDQQTRVTVEGVVTEFDYRNPHSFLYLRTTDSAGDTIDMTIEAQGSSLRPFGVTPDSLTAGEHVTAVIHPSRRSPNEWGLGIEVIKEDGTIVPLQNRYARRPEQRNTGTTTSIAGVWVPRDEDFFTFVRSRASLPLTEKGRESLERFNVNQSSHAECIAVPPPTLMLYGSINVVEVLDDRVLIHSDWMGAERVIYTDGRNPADGQGPTLYGYSVGHWEDDTLVVETTHFSENNSGIAAGIASSPQKRLTERFELADDGSDLTYSFAVEDPEYLAEPASGSSRWDYRPDLSPDDVPCDLESAARYLSE